MSVCPMTFHPEWGCLAPAPSFVRALRTVLIASAFGAIAGGGAVLALVDQSAGDHRSVAGRTLVRLMPAAPTSVSGTQTAQLVRTAVYEGGSQNASGTIGHGGDAGRGTSNATTASRPKAVGASAELHLVNDNEAALSLRGQTRLTSAGKKAERHKGTIRTSKPTQHLMRQVARQAAPDVVQKL